MEQQFKPFVMERTIASIQTSFSFSNNLTIEINLYNLRYESYF